MLVCPLPTVEPVVFFPQTPIAAAVKQALFEQQLEALEKQLVPLQSVEQRSPLARLSDHFGSLPDPREAGLVEHKLLGRFQAWIEPSTK